MKPISAIIVEDETNAAKNLEYILEEVDPQVVILSVLPSIAQAVKWLQANKSPTIGFFDIQLEDGQSFEIFRRVPIKFPVVFTTAFNEYAIEAFKVNSIDYLLKPVQKEALAFSLEKFRSLQTNAVSEDNLNSILGLLREENTPTTLLVRYRDKLIPVLLNDFAYFFIENEIVHGSTFKNQSYTIDQTIEQLQSSVNERRFFRANRQFLINRTAIQEMEVFFNGRLVVKLSPVAPSPVLISKAKLPSFRKWLQSSLPG